ncbi:MAG: NADH-quinone oxidoreductase subunit M [Pirellulales bacterium]|nr:NADH-quinone oxidoreductase subunit M [Pirellulales bacterium]
MDSTSLLLISLGLPMLGALAIAISGAAAPEWAKWIALATALATLGVAGTVTYHGAQAATPDFAVTQVDWLGTNSPVKVQFHVGLDGLGLWMYGLSALLTVTAILVSWTAITERVAGFYALLMLLAAGMLGVFAARDIFLFYVFFEFTLIPLFFLIGIWGSEERRYAAVKFFLFTLAGSLLTFLSLLAIVWYAGQFTPNRVLTFSIPELTAILREHPLPNNAENGYWQSWIFLGLFAGFAIKVPLFPLHTWLPLAHVQAPTAGSVILAGVLLKIGTYGFVRFSLPMLPLATVHSMPWILGLSCAGIIYGALVALAQSDIKRLIAYSSVSHLGFCMLGIFAINKPGLSGGILQMVNHGLSTGGLFAVVGMIYERYHTRQISQLGGLARRLPWLTVMMILFTFSSIGLPGLNGFVGEFLVLTGMFQRGWLAPVNWDPLMMWIAVLSVSGVVLGAWYMLYLVERVFFGPLHEPQSHSPGHGHTIHDHAGQEHAGHGPGGHQSTGQHHADQRQASHGHGSPDHGHAGAHAEHADGHTAGHGHDLPPLPPGPADLNWREFFALAPLLVFIVWIGLSPQQFLRPIEPIWDVAGQPVLQSLETYKQQATAAAQPMSNTTTTQADTTTPGEKSNVDPSPQALAQIAPVSP